MPKERVVEIAGKEYRLRYSLLDRDAIERALGDKTLMEAAASGTIRSVAAFIWGGLRYRNRKQSVEDVLEMLSEHQKAGGNYDGIAKVAMRAMVEANIFPPSINSAFLDRIFGKEDAEDEEGKDERPAVVAE